MTPHNIPAYTNDGRDDVEPIEILNGQDTVVEADQSDPADLDDPVEEPAEDGEDIDDFNEEDAEDE